MKRGEREWGQEGRGEIKKTEGSGVTANIERGGGTTRARDQRIFLGPGCAKKSQLRRFEGGKGRKCEITKRKDSLRRPVVRKKDG